MAKNNKKDAHATFIMRPWSLVVFFIYFVYSMCLIVCKTINSQKRAGFNCLTHLHWVRVVENRMSSHV